MKAIEAKYKSKFRQKLKWYKQDQNNPILRCIIDDFDSVISDIFLELNNRNCISCKYSFDIFTEVDDSLLGKDFICTKLEIDKVFEKDFYCSKYEPKQ